MCWTIKAKWFRSNSMFGNWFVVILFHLMIWKEWLVFECWHAAVWQKKLKQRLLYWTPDFPHVWHKEAFHACEHQEDSRTRYGQWAWDLKLWMTTSSSVHNNNNQTVSSEKIVMISRSWIASVPHYIGPTTVCLSSQLINRRHHSTHPPLPPHHPTPPGQEEGRELCAIAVHWLQFNI